MDVTMKRQVWTLSLLSVLGCGSNVELGQANPLEGGPGRAGGLQKFAPVNGRMCGVFEGGKTYCWGRSGSPDPERATNLDGVALAGRNGILLVCAVRADGTLACASDADSPLQEQLGVSNAVDVSVAGGEICTLGSDGTLQHRFTQNCRGEGDPRPIQLPSPAVEARCGDRGCCAATQDGRLFCFNGSTEHGCDVSFEEAPGIHDAVGVSMTMEGVCVLHEDGTVSCTNELDLDTWFPDLTAFERVDISDVVQLRSSRVATCGLTRSGSLHCWGLSQCGALGISEGCGSTYVNAPIVVQQDIQTRLFGMDDGYTCSLDANDDVWCWGFSAWTGTAQGSPTPRLIRF